MIFALVVFLMIVGVLVAMMIGVRLANRLTRLTDTAKKQPPERQGPSAEPLRRRGADRGIWPSDVLRRVRP
jgi:hypothetical protein